MWEPTAAERNWHCFSPARSHQSPHRYTNGFLHAMEALQPWAAHQWSVLPPVAPVTLPVHNVELGLSSEDETAALLPRGAGGLVGAQRARPQPRGTLNDALIAARGRGPMPRRTASLGGALASAQPATDGCPPSSASPPLLGSFRVVGGLHGANGPAAPTPSAAGARNPHARTRASPLQLPGTPGPVGSDWDRGTPLRPVLPAPPSPAPPPPPIVIPCSGAHPWQRTHAAVTHRPARGCAAGGGPRRLALAGEPS